MKNWYNHNIELLKWKESAIYKAVVFYFLISIVPIIGIIVIILSNFRYLTFRNIKIKPELL